MINEKILEILEELTGRFRIFDNSLLFEELGLDSLGMVIMLIAIEDKFEIELEESDMNLFELKTVEDVRNLVSKYVG